MFNMNDQVYPNEGLIDIWMQAIAQLVTISSPLQWDLCLFVPPDPANLTTWALGNWGQDTGQFSVSSANTDGDNRTLYLDFLANPYGVFANNGLVQAYPITFTNVSGSAQTIYGYGAWNPNQFVTGSEALWTFTIFSAPLIIPVLDTFVLFPLLGNISVLDE
jgi:hypothetical protein